MLAAPWNLGKDRAVGSNTVSWAQPACECVCARVYTYALSMSLHLWFSAVSFQTPVDPPDTLCNPGDPPRQEAQLKPAWIPDPSGCEAGNTWSLKSPSLRLFVPVTADFLCAPCQKEAELGLNGLPAEALQAGPRRLPARGPRSNCMATGELGPEARPGLPAGTLVSRLLARGPRALPCGGATGEEAPGWWLVSGPAGGPARSGARPPVPSRP